MTLTLHRVARGIYAVRLDGADAGEIRQDTRGRWHGGRSFGRDRDTVARALADAPASAPVTIGAHVRPSLIGA